MTAERLTYCDGSHQEKANMKIKDLDGDTIEVSKFNCDNFIDVLTREGDGFNASARVHLTRKQSKKLRKALKAAEAEIK